MRHVTAGLGLLVVMFVFLFVYVPLPVHAASTLVQQKEGICLTCLTLPVSFSSNVAAGDVVVVTVALIGTLSSVADSFSSVFTQAAAFSCGFGGDFCYAYYTTLSSSGSDTITLTASSTSNIVGYIYEVSGVAAPPTVTAVNTALGNTVSTASTNFQSGAFLLGSIFMSGGPFTITPGSSFTLSSCCTAALIEQYSTSGVSSPTTFPATITASVLFTWWEVGLVFNPAGPIPEYPLGLPILAILVLIGYGLIRRRARIS